MATGTWLRQTTGRAPMLRHEKHDESKDVPCTAKRLFDRKTYGLRQTIILTEKLTDFTLFTWGCLGQTTRHTQTPTHKHIKYQPNRPAEHVCK